MGLKLRIWLLPVIATGIFLLGGVIVGTVSSRADSAVTAVGATDYPFLDQVGRFSVQLDSFQQLVSAAVATGEPAKLDEAKTVSGSIEQTLQALQASGKRTDQVRALADQFGAYRDSAVQAARIILSLEHGDSAEAVTRMQAGQATLRKTLEAIEGDAKADFDNALGRASTGIHAAVWAMAAGVLVVVAVMGVASYLLVGSIWRQVGGEPDYARSLLQSMARGDLGQNVRFDPRAPESILAAMQEMSTGLSELIAKIRGGSESIAHASCEIADGNQDLSHRTESQAHSLQRTAASMEQISTTVRQSAGNAQEATQIAERARSAADAGGQVVGQVIETMDEILHSSRKIEEIVGVIDGIAFQTNILALNAAVEAARAGEDGRGFAVVAGEVRALAQRSAQAAREIKNMISTSVARIDAGSQLVHRAGESMGEIVNEVNRVNELMAQISQAAVEQSNGIAEVSDSVSQMDQVTQQNAALVEQSAAAADTLRADSERLTQAVAVFKIADEAAIA